MRKLSMTGILVIVALMGTLPAQTLLTRDPAAAGTIVEGDALPGPIVTMGDFNHDGIEDLLIAEPSGPKLWLGDGQGHFQRPESSQAPLERFGTGKDSTPASGLCIPDCRWCITDCSSVDCGQGWCSYYYDMCCDQVCVVCR